jgi:predicted RNA binding protein YcfA (HicA-like mRNA interferase family)
MKYILKPLELCRILESSGFECVRQRGSHRQYRNTISGHQTTVPIHKGRDIAPGLLRQIAKDIGLTLDELWNLR